MSPRRRVLLIILDGFGVNPSRLDNPVAMAETPNLDRYLAANAHALIQASGEAVGLPDGQMGNSEVGHLTLGCGSVIRQDLVKINDAIRDRSFERNPALLDACNKAREQGRPLHLIGLVSDGGVHSHIDHLLALIELCRKQQVRPLLHMITDGRDTAPHSALEYLDRLDRALTRAGGDIASVTGRYYAMDRDRRWDRTERAWRLLIHGKGRRAGSAREAIDLAYAANESDEFIQPTVLPSWEPLAAGQPLLFFNFRKDRPRQLLESLHTQDFLGFDRGDFPRPAVYALMPYDRSFNVPTAFEPERPATCLGEIVSRCGLSQLHCAETEKYAHVTYFFNGGRQTPFRGEKQLLIPSPKVRTYDLAPAMSAPQVADTVIKALHERSADFILVNFANGDMVGHTAVRHAIIEAIEAMDRELGRVLDAAAAADYSVVLTADHGNCEELTDPTSGAPQTQHTAYPVPFMVMDELDWTLSNSGGLADVAPTVLQLLGIQQPEAMTGRSMLLKSRPKPQRSGQLVGAA